MNIKNIKNLFTFIALVAIIAASCPLIGMNNDNEQKKIELPSASQPFLSKKTAIYSAIAATSLLLLLTQPKLRKHITLKNTAIGLSVGFVGATAYGIASLYQYYQYYKTLPINEEPNMKMAINMAISFLKAMYFPTKKPETVISLKESLTNELNMLIQSIKKETKRFDLKDTIFIELLKKEPSEFKYIYEDLEKETLSLEKYNVHMQTVKEYQTKYLEKITEYIASLLPKPEYSSFKQLDKNPHKNEIIQKHNPLLKNMAQQFIEKIFNNNKTTKALIGTYGNDYYCADTIDFLMTEIIIDLKPFEKEKNAKVIFENLCEYLGYPNDKKINRLCNRYNKKIEIFKTEQLRSKIEQELSNIETTVKNSIPTEDHDSAINLLKIHLKGAYTIIKDKVKMMDVLFKCISDLKSINIELLMKHIDLIKLEKENHVNFIKQTDETFEIPSNIHPIQPKELVTLYCCEENKDNLLFLKYGQLYRAFQENKFLYDLCYMWGKEIYEIHDKDLFNFYITNLQKKIFCDRNFIKSLEKTMLEQAQQFKTYTQKIMPILKQNGASDELMKCLNDYKTVKIDSLKKMF